MKSSDVLHWSPRILGVLFACFLGLFALDAFSSGGGLGQQILAFLIHLFPAYLIVAALWIAWSRQLPGGILFLGLGLVYVLLAWQRFPFTTLLTISGPAFLIGILFLLDNGLRRSARR